MRPENGTFLCAVWKAHLRGAVRIFGEKFVQAQKMPYFCMMMNNFSFKPRRRVLLIYTGGTIGMIRNPATGGLEAFNFDHLRSHVPELDQFGYVIRTWQFDPPIDSSDMDPRLWAKLVRIIDWNYDAFDGFVILHGTDTMAYTASALSFMLENLAKPVVLTGSQLPVGVLRTDGRENLINAIELAAACDADGRPMVPEVSVCFGGQLLRGNRTTKCSSESFRAFASYNCPPLAVTGINIHFNRENIRRPVPGAAFRPHPETDSSVVAVTLFPGIRADVLQHIFAMPDLRGIVLRTYGSGNAPRLPWLIDAIRGATADGKVVVNITQCQQGMVEMEMYETGRQLLTAGVVGGHDMTVECAVTKLMCLFGQGRNPHEVRTLMGSSLAGELTQ